MTNTTTSAPSDPTFRSYDPEQAAAYGRSRLSYSVKLYEAIKAYHKGIYGTLLDVGCGPGNATRDLAPWFENAVGMDPGVEMINTARSLGGTTKTGESIKFVVQAAEKCDEVQGSEGGVDMIVSAMAAHWFSMPEFWNSAAKVLKPGGTVALWTKASLYCHPSTPNARKVQEILSHLEDNILGPFELPPNRISRGLYDDLSLPWMSAPPKPFSESDFVRVEWNRDGVIEDAEDDFLDSSEGITLEELEAGLGTASMVTRWREANPSLSGTVQDCVRETIASVRKALQEAGGVSDTIRTGSGTALLLFRKSATV